MDGVVVGCALGVSDSGVGFTVVGCCVSLSEVVCYKGDMLVFSLSAWVPRIRGDRKRL